MKRYSVTDYEDGRSRDLPDLEETAAKTPAGFLALFYRRNRNASRGAFACLGPDADGAYAIYTKAGSYPVERYRPVR
ncbi:hypothetical protein PAPPERLAPAPP_01220 [Brevundimonas phage vB_BpoS-Papperlapapp]|uniref:Uncharacterized protein n=2 Tax=Marchewkavirus TaxID=3425052 RepID=A0A9E7MPP7_9CAUD|nr:hypothetical protein KABACHOK_05450 [Brevundimonas phage vB_BpoS-Kabachok]USN14491.1 hypothetical protein DOMOVOI_00160 [Brevundimonas phage vB_BpoS-Domovoi]USN15864.1 hypothetical protein PAPPERLAPAPP_01220 [Brevundimonas phage vB_BpoS-Papperlapapp]